MPGKAKYFLTALGLALSVLLISGCASKDAAMEKWWAEAIPMEIPGQDTGGRGLNVADVLIEGGRQEIKRRPYYRSRYIENGGYPPSPEGVCTDLVWRAFSYAGYDLKSMIKLDAELSPKAYPGLKGLPDPNIDFRRVPNQKAFFERFGRHLTTEIRPGDAANLADWQAGDIVTFKDPAHVAIVSPRRNARGVPYLIHNPGPRPVEADDLWPLYKRNRLSGHYRFPKD